jgi:type III pantothenate kinase
MKLLIDAGNTRIKWALVEGDDWLRNGALPVGQASELPGLFADSPDILQIWVSNVAGDGIAQHLLNIRTGLSVPVHFIAAQEMQCGVRNGYAAAAQLGCDRWAALIAAWHLTKRNCLVVNCGTAITIDALSAQGEFLGGLIVPGIELMQRSLISATDRLKSGQLKPGQGKYAPFPASTADALFSGAIQAGCGAIQRQHALLGDESAPVVLSGGTAEALREHLGFTPAAATRAAYHSRPHLNLPLRIVDNLVLQGLLLISKESSA